MCINRVTVYHYRHIHYKYHKSQLTKLLTNLAKYGANPWKNEATIFTWPWSASQGSARTHPGSIDFTSRYCSRVFRCSFPIFPWVDDSWCMYLRIKTQVNWVSQWFHILKSIRILCSVIVFGQATLGMQKKTSQMDLGDQQCDSFLKKQPVCLKIHGVLTNSDVVQPRDYRTGILMGPFRTANMFNSLDSRGR